MKQLLIVGAGITGLLTALRIYKNYKVTVIDLGPDPRVSQNLTGATYSGLDARHISFTETAPWTSQHRYDLIMKDSADGGWLSIPKEDLNDFDKQWIAQFQEITHENNLHKTNTEAVIKLNIQGIQEWEKLDEEYDFLKPINDETVMPIICPTKETLLEEFSFESSLDKRCKLYEDKGYFTLYGQTYRIKTICNDLINFLESKGALFKWNQNFSETNTDLIVWCAGVSEQSSKILRQFNILLGGVVGCWVLMDNPGIKEAYKIYGPEPVNYLNITPYEQTLSISGGYGFVGTRSYEEAKQLAQPIMDSMVEELKKWLPEGKIKEKAFCIRPATPSGVPVLFKDKLNNIPIIFAVGHCAGGFTQAPYTAKQIENML